MTIINRWAVLAVVREILEWLEIIWLWLRIAVMALGLYIGYCIVMIVVSGLIMSMMGK
jgi:hypothetical protein